MRFIGFLSHATSMRVFENPFSVEVNDAAEKLQLELPELQYNPIFHNSLS
jgi:hypothetical protein